MILIDEALTPDSSRFWPADQYEAGRGQPSFDKQFVRDYLEEIRWNKQPPAPELPAGRRREDGREVPRGVPHPDRPGADPAVTVLAPDVAEFIKGAAHRRRWPRSAPTAARTRRPSGTSTTARSS